jgi:mono/diheme cytochrome c family protein
MRPSTKKGLGVPNLVNLVKVVALVGLVLPVGVAYASSTGPALFADKGCVTCHGDKGQGNAGLAPALKGNDWVVSAAEADIVQTIRKGRKGQNRRHPNIPGGMPPVSMPEEEAQVLAKFLKGEMQK